MPIARGLSLLYPVFVVLWLGSERALFIPSLVLAYLVVGAAYAVVYGLAGDWMLRKSPATERDLTARSGHVLPRALWHGLFAGIVVALPVLPVIAAIAPKPDRRTQATAAMKLDLQNLVTAQGSYFAERKRFASSLDSLAYESSAHVTVALVHVDSVSFAAEASYGSTAQRCRISVGHWQAGPADAFNAVPLCDAERGSY